VNEGQGRAEGVWGLHLGAQGTCVGQVMGAWAPFVRAERTPWAQARRLRGGRRG
jgi:hypothetical protein